MEQTFAITITSCENGTWQGTLQTAAETVSFQSELQLLQELDRRVSPQDPPP